MKQIYNIMVGMALMLGATSCEKEILDNGQAAGIALADGQFIVDYSGEVTTRAIKDNAEKGERINSLTYLLYIQQDNDYVLEKRREIPGLNKNKTDDAGNPVYESWPLTRDNMTWEQREALKDTLMVGSNYRAVFVANAAASLWDGTNSPLVGADLPTNGSAAPSYSSAYLQLPANLAFNDGNMFYLAEAEINGAGQDRNTPYNCPITLKRVVTRTDWWFERLPELWTEPDETGNRTFTEDAIAYINSNGLNMILSNILAGENPTVVVAAINFLDLIKDRFDVLATPEEGQSQTELQQVYSLYSQAIEDLKTLINGTERQTFISTLFSDSEDQEVESAWDSLTDKLLSLLQNNTQLQGQWQRSVEENQYAEIVYDGESGMNRYYLDSSKGTECDATTSFPRVQADLETSDLGDLNDYIGFNWISFANPEQNMVAEIKWYEGATATGELFALTPNLKTGQGTNEWYQVVYRPVASLSLKDGYSDVESFSFVFDLEAALPFDKITSGVTAENVDAFKEAINDILEDATLTDLDFYGDALNTITLSFDIPDISSDGVLNIAESWSTPQKVEK